MEATQFAEQLHRGTCAGAGTSSGPSREVSAPQFMHLERLLGQILSQNRDILLLGPLPSVAGPIAEEMPSAGPG